MKNLITAIALGIITISSHAQITLDEVKQMVQTADETQLVVESSRMLQEDYFYFSEVVVDKLLEINPESSNYNYRKGFIELYSRNDYKTAITHLTKASQEIAKAYDMYSARETGAPVDVYYHLGKAYHLDEQLSKAIENYNLFIQNSRKKSELLDQSQLGIVQCELAKEMISHPKEAEVRNLKSPVNTEYPEYSPFISFDGNSLYFTSRRPWDDNSTEEMRDPKFYQYPEDIYVSILDATGDWSEPKRLDFCSPEVNEATIAVSTEETKVYAYQDVIGNGDIYYSDFNSNKFSVLEHLDISGVNTDYWETHCSVTRDGSNIYFVSERPEGYGGRDIYRIVKMADGRWSEPQNLGPTINTPYDEESPFIAIDNKTMYFASNGPNSIGGFDIFVTVRDDMNNWSTPINLGYPINKTGDDLFFTTTVDGKKGYLSSFRENGQGEKDIYEIINEYLGIKGVVVLTGKINALGNAVLEKDAHVIVKCPDCQVKEKKLTLRPRDGAFMTKLESCREYDIVFMKNDSEVITTKHFNTSCNKEYEEVHKEAYIADYDLTGVVVEKNTGYPLKNVTVQIYDQKDSSLLETLTTDENGRFVSFLLDKQKYGDSINYILKFSKDSYFTLTHDIDHRLDTNIHVVQKIHLSNINIGDDLANIIQINPIYFDVNKSDIRPDAQLELDKIVKIMNDNPTINIELGSHTDCRASKRYNLSLSDRRAKASAEYIKTRISDPSRIYGKGYGESKLVNDCGCEGRVKSDCSEEEHQANRRTEFRIVKK